jgi:BirA family biotin operon repressor/biotin-[acetyl-CoA-carboxylase] ligase
MRNKSRGTRSPAILDRLALAGPQGLELSGSPAEGDEIRVCLEWGYPLAFEGDRVSLSSHPDPLVSAWITSETAAIYWDRISPVGYLEIGSTNEEALELARQGAPAGTLIYAERQTAGRGRSGRKWHSPRGSGLYFSAITYPRRPASDWPILTHGAAVALYDTLRELERPLDRRKLDIKWPNDLLISGKKVAGILLETCQGEAWGGAAVIGIGVNIGPASIPEELKNDATCLSMEAGIPVHRRSVLVRVLFHLQRMLERFDRGELDVILEQWKERSSMWSGRTIWVVEGNKSRPAVTCGVSEIGGLKIRSEDGSEETLLAGDIRVRSAAPPKGETQS